jgi:cytochrome c
MRFFLRLLSSAAILAACGVALGQTAALKNLGRAPTEEEIRAWDIAISTDGKELPPGRGMAKDGAPIYADKCARCHGATGQEGQLGPRLVGGKGTLDTLQPVMTVGSYWPFATTVWDYIHRAMPRMKEGSLSADEVYSLTAFLLYKNGIIEKNDVMDAKSLPKIQMPNRNGFVTPRLEDIGDVRKRDCVLGHCR